MNKSELELDLNQHIYNVKAHLADNHCQLSETSLSSIVALLYLLKPSELDNIKSIYHKISNSNSDSPEHCVINIMCRFNYIAIEVDTTQSLQTIEYPCLIINNRKKKKQNLHILYRKEDKIFRYDVENDTHKAITNLETKDKIYKFAEFNEDDFELAVRNRTLLETTWFNALIKRFRSFFIEFLLLSLVLHLLSLAIPIYVLLVYDKVIYTGNINTLLYLTAGVTIALVAESCLKYIRTKNIAWLGSRVDNIVNTSVIEKLLSLKLTTVESAPIASQIARIKSFSTLRDFFTGPIFTTLLELPFTIILIFIIGLISGWLVLIPLFAILVYLIIGLLAYNKLKILIKITATNNTEKQALLIEILDKINSLRFIGLTKYYIVKIQQLSLQYKSINFRSLFFTHVIDCVVRGVSILAAILTVMIGVMMIWNAAITPGSLIASLFILWRVLSPIQYFISSISRVEKLKKSIQQVDNFMDLDSEFNQRIDRITHKTIYGNIKAINLSIYYTKLSNLIIRNLSFDINEGECVAVIGNNGSGKTTLLKLMNGLNTPNVGKILIDNKEIKQFNLNDIRENIVYMPQKPTLFNGTIADNIRMVSPNISTHEIIYLLEQVNAMNNISLLENGIDTEVSADAFQNLPKSLLYKINLARVYALQSKILLLDELPGMIMNDECGQNLIENIKVWRGKKTIFYVTNRQNLIELADKVIVFRKYGTALVKNYDDIKHLSINELLYE